MIEGLKRKVSPRAPTLALDEAMVRVHKMYKAEGRHATPAEVAMKHIGYSSKNGAAVKAIASLGYFGLLERPKDGVVMVAKLAEDYQFTPDDSHKKELLLQFLSSPPLFAELLARYQDRLPSDATIKYDLIQLGFIPATADSCVSVFKRSVEFAGYFDRSKVEPGNAEEDSSPDLPNDERDEVLPIITDLPLSSRESLAPSPVPNRDRLGVNVHAEHELDRIPIRLGGGRRAWLEIPAPFFSADKKRLKKHIDLLLTDDEDDLLDDVSTDH